MTKFEYPFVKDKNHIFNKLTDHGIGYVDIGWRKFYFELHAEIIEEGDFCNGLTDMDKGTISLDIKMADELAREIILHEIVHCILEGAGLDEDYFPKGMTVSNEHLVRVISRGLVTIANLNPKLMKLLYA